MPLFRKRNSKSETAPNRSFENVRPGSEHRGSILASVNMVLHQVAKTCLPFGTARFVNVRMYSWEAISYESKIWSGNRCRNFFSFFVLLSFSFFLHCWAMRQSNTDSACANRRRGRRIDQSKEFPEPLRILFFPAKVSMLLKRCFRKHPERFLTVRVRPSEERDLHPFSVFILFFLLALISSFNI